MNQQRMSIIGIVGIFLFVSSSVIAQTTATVNITNPSEEDILRNTISINADIVVSYGFQQTSTGGRRNSGFGWRPSTNSNHQGVDTADPIGTEVRAVAAGVATARINPGGYGYYIVVNHGNGLYTLYGHLQNHGYGNRVRIGQVTDGQVIGYSGNSGRGTGPHLHFGIWQGRLFDPNSAINPDDYLPTSTRIKSAIDGNKLHVHDYAVGVNNINYSTNWNTTQVKDGGHGVTVTALRLSNLANGKFDELEIGNDSININIDNTPPITENEQPKDSEIIIAEEVPYEVNISAQLSDPEVNGYASGINQDTVRLNTPQGVFKTNQAVNHLDYGEYSCSITCKDNANNGGNILDGDKDKKENPPSRWSFVIMPPIEVSIKPTWQSFTVPNESHIHDIVITNKGSKEFTANIEMRLIKSSDCLSITQRPALTIEVPANSSAKTSFVISSGGELKPDDNLIHQIIVSVPGVKISGIQYANGQNVITDHPDESYDISDPKYPTSARIDSEARVGVYLNGFVDGVAHLLGRFKEPVWFIDRDFVPLLSEIAQGSPPIEQISQSPLISQISEKSTQSENPRNLQDFKVLIIPSYGLSGVDSSEILKARLRKYVESGGIVVCFTQKYGQEFGFLPGSLTGYGANEDQACWTNAASIDEYHPIVSGQDSVNLDCNADGYFTGWGDAKVVLRRVKNQMPAMVMYPYGKGWVIASGLYPDWGYGHNQWSQDEAALVRDLITWAKQPDLEIPETKPGGTITVKTAICNLTSQIASGVIIKVTDPDKKPLPPCTIELTPTLAFNQEKELILTSDTISSLSSLNKLGIYEINYELKGTDDQIIQEETRGSQFAISEHYINSTNLDGYKIWAAANEQVAAGSNVVYTVFVRNDTDTDFTGNIAVGVHEERASGGRWWAIVGVIPSVNIPAHSQKSFVFERKVNISASTYFGLFPMGADYETYFLQGAISTCEKGVRVIKPVIDMQIITDKRQNIDGNNISIALNLNNKKAIDYEISTNLRVFNPDNAIIFATTTTLILAPSGSVSLAYKFSLPQDARPGIYIVQAEANKDSERIGITTGSFEMPPTALSLQLLPFTLIPMATNTINFEVKNIGIGVVTEGEITVIIKDPDNNLLWQGTSTFGTILVAGTTSSSCNVPVSEIKFGNYSLEYYFLSDDKFIFNQEDISCEILIKQELDKPSYRIRDNLSGTITIINTGKFYEDLEVIWSIPDCGIVETKSITLMPNETKSLSNSFIISETITAGLHDGIVTCRLAAGSSQSKNFKFAIPEAAPEFVLDKTDYSAGENNSVIVKNVGGVDGEWNYKIWIYDLIEYKRIYENRGKLSLSAGSSSIVGFEIPQQAVTGRYKVGLEMEKWEWDRYININGLKADITVETDKNVYFTDEQIAARIEIDNLEGVIDSASLAVKVYSSFPDWTVFTDIKETLDIAVDGDDIWVVTCGGVKRYTKSNETWQIYTTDDGLASNEVNCVAVGRDAVWFGAYEGISRYTKSTNTWNTYTTENSGLVDNDIRTIAVDGDDIWFGAYGGGVSRYDKSANIWQTYGTENSGLMDDDIEAIAVDGDDIWFGALNDGVSRYNKSTNTWNTYTTENSGLVNNSIDAIAIDGDDIWFGSWNGGVSRYNKLTNAWQTYGTENSGLVDNRIRAIAVDGDAIWFVTWGVVCKYDKTALWQTYADDFYGLVDNWIRAIAVDGDAVWFGSVDGVSRYNKSINTWQTYTTENSGLVYGGIHAIAVDGDDIWFGHRGVSRYHKPTNTWQTYTKENDKLVDNNIRAIAVDGDDIWFGTKYGVSRYYKPTNTWQTYTKENSGLVDNNIHAIIVDEDDIWFGTYRGVSRYHKLTNTWQTYTLWNSELVDYDIGAIAVDGDAIWFGVMQYGISKYHKSTNTWQIYTKENSGLVDNSTTAIAVDEDSIWFGSAENGVSRYKKRGDAIWQKEIPVSIESGVKNINEINISNMNAVGKFYIESMLNSTTGQRIASDIDHFYIFASDIYLVFETDKKVYKPNEVITITGTVTNNGIIPEKNLNLVLSRDGRLISNSTFDLGSGTTYSFITTTTSGSSFVLKGKVKVVEVADNIIVEEDKIAVDINCPAIVKQGTNTFVITLKNIGKSVVKVNANCSLKNEKWKYGTITIDANKAIVIEERFSMIDDGAITVTITGDIFGTWTKFVEFGEKVELNDIPDNIYPMGYMEIPFEITNSGKLDSAFTATWTLTRLQQLIKRANAPEISSTLQNTRWCNALPRVIIKGQKTLKASPLSPANNPHPAASILNDTISLVYNFYVPVGGTITGSLVFDLGEGTYSLSHEYFRGTASSNFTVAKENVAKILDFGFSILDCRFVVKAENLGSNRFNGELNFQTPFYQTKTAISLDTGQGATYTFGLREGTQTVLLCGSYTAIARIFSNGNEIDKREMGFDLEPGFEIQGVEGLGFKVGEEGTISVGIKNIGNAMGEVKIKMKLLDLIDTEMSIWLKPQEAGSVSFRLSVPVDFEDGSYTTGVRVQWTGVSGKGYEDKRFLVRINGIKLTVAANLDREAYKEGEMGTLTLTIANLSSAELGTLNLSAKIKFNNYASTTTFSLPTFNFLPLTFNLPIHHSGQKLNFGIYSEDDRAIWLDSIYVREKGTITIVSDKQKYGQGETVTLTIIMQEAGTVTLTMPGTSAIASIVFNESGSKTIGFKLPEKMLTGSYYINAEYGLQGVECRIDVQGIRVVVKETLLDKGGYETGEQIQLLLKVDISDGFDGRIKAWIENKNGSSNILDIPKVFFPGINECKIIGTVSSLGIQRLTYGIYSGNESLIVSGSRQIDVYNVKKDTKKVITKGPFSVEIPEGGLKTDIGSYIALSLIDKIAVSSKGTRLITGISFITEPIDTELIKPIKVVFNYQGISADIIEKSLKAYHLRDGSLDIIEDQDLDVVNKQITFYSSNLSPIAIGARVVERLEDLIVYPNPATGVVTFGDNLPSQIGLRIFNITGEEIYGYEGQSNAGKWVWRLQNNDNQRIASGIYIFVISTDTEKRVGKIGVIR